MDAQRSGVPIRPAFRNSVGHVEDYWPRPCSVCGVPYDGRLRGVEGRFHMAVFIVEDDDPIILVDHWREGVIPPNGSYTLRSGSAETPFTAEALPPPSQAAGQRGQLRLRVLDGLPHGTGTGCVWGSG